MSRHHVRAPLADVAAAAIYTALACLVFSRLLADVDQRYLSDGVSDQQQWEWFFAVTAKHVAELDNPLFTTLQNHPVGVNLMANTVMLGLSVPLAPVTLLHGPSVTWALVMTAGLAASAFAWYWLISRRLVLSRFAAAVGAGLCGFAPSIVSHANAHPNFVVLFMIPLIVDRLLRLSEGRRTIRDGIVLGLLVAYQIFLGEEALLLAATGLVVFAAAYAVLRPREARVVAAPLLKGVGLGALVALPLVAYPLLWQFFGPQSYDSLPHGPSGNPLAAFAAFSTQSLAGDPETARVLSINRTEENAFVGWPLLVFAAVLATWLWRLVVVRALMTLVVVAGVLSLGSPGPWLLLAQLPLYESVLESRLAMICVPALGILVALGIGRMLELAKPARVLGLAGCALALLPIAPTPLVASEREPVPAFFADGGWREYVRPGRAVVPVPPTDPGNVSALGWQVAAGLEFPVPEGYFVGPWGGTRQGAYGPYPRPTAHLLRRIRDGENVVVTAPDRQQALVDLAFWQADAVVLAGQPRAPELRAALEDLLGPGKYVGGVWVWDVRGR